MNKNKEIPIDIKNFRNLKNLKLKFLEGKMNVILGKNNVGKSNLLDYINSWYIKNDKSGVHEIFYLKDGERFTKHLSSPIIFEVKKVLLLSAKENKEKNLILRSFECNEHHYFEIESFIFGIKQNIVLTKCLRSLMFCSLKDYKELYWNERKSDYLKSPILISELETILKEGIFFLFDEILKNVKVLSSQRFYGLGELLTHKREGKSEGFYFKFGFSFLDPWDGKKKPLGLGAEKIIFLNLLINTLQTEEKLLVLDTKNDRKWRHEKWIFSFLPSSGQKSVVLVDKPETFLNPSYERKIFLSLKKLTEERSNCDVIMATNSSECLVSFPSEIYDGSLRTAILDESGKVVYLNKIIERIKKPIIETCSKYGKLFEKDLKKDPDAFYRNKWKEILSREYTSRIFFSEKVLFVEGSTEVIFFSSFALNLLFKELKKKTSEQLEKFDKLVEETSLSKEKKAMSSEEEISKSIWAKQQRDDYKSNYVIDESEFWKKFNEIKIIPIFGKFNYIFFAKISESLLLEHKFVLDEDKEVLDEEEVTDWGKFYDTNNPEGRKQQLESWKKYEVSPQEAQKAWNEGWRWPNHKFFFNSASYCKTGEKNDCYCNNIIWIRGELEKFINLKKTREFGKTPEMNLIENLPNVVENLVNSESEKWRVILKPILREWGWKEYKLCRRKEIEKYRNE